MADNTDILLSDDGVPDDLQIDQEQTDYLRSSYEEQADVLSGAMESLLESAAETSAGIVDTDALIGVLQDNFAKTSSQTIATATAAGNKAMLELDSYMGSSQSDARSAVRFRLANEVTQGVLSDAYAALDTSFSNYAASIVDTTLSAASINSPFILEQTSQIANLATAGVSLYSAMASATNEVQVANLNAAMGWANANLELYKTDAQVQMAQEANDLQWANLDFQVEQWAVGLMPTNAGQGWEWDSKRNAQEIASRASEYAANN